LILRSRCDDATFLLSLDRLLLDLIERPLPAALLLLLDDNFLPRVDDDLVVILEISSSKGPFG